MYYIFYQIIDDYLNGTVDLEMTGHWAMSDSVSLVSINSFRH